MALYNCRLKRKEKKNFKHTTTQEFKRKTCIWFSERLVHSLKILNAFANPNSIKQNEKKRCSNLKNKKKQSSISTQIHKMKLAFESLNLLQIFCRQFSYWSCSNLNEKDLAHKERFCSNSKNQ